MDNTCYGCPDCSRQDEATFLVMWPSEPSQPLPGSSQTQLLTGQGAEFIAQRCPHSPLATVPRALVTLVNSNSTIKSTSDVFLQLSLASPPTFPPTAFPVCLPMSWWSCMHSSDCYSCAAVFRVLLSDWAGGAEKSRTLTSSLCTQRLTHYLTCRGWRVNICSVEGVVLQRRPFRISLLYVWA